MAILEGRKALVSRGGYIWAAHLMLLSVGWLYPKPMIINTRSYSYLSRQPCQPHGEPWTQLLDYEHSFQGLLSRYIHFFPHLQTSQYITL